MKKHLLWFFAIIGILLIVTVGCKNKVPPTTSSTQNPTHGNYDNSEYTLIRNTLEVTGIGSATNRQIAKDKSLNNAKRTAVETLTTLVKQVAGKRQFPVKEPVTFTLPALQNIKYDYIRGEKAVFSCVADISLQAVTKDLYICIDAPSEYGYYQFLRDLDLVMQLNQFKSEFNKIIKE